MGLDEFESIMRQAAWSLEVEGQHPDAQTMEWCRQMLAGEISLEKYLNFSDSSGNGIVGALHSFFRGTFFVIFDYCSAVFAYGFQV